MEEFRHKLGVRHQHCAAVGRSPEPVELSVQTLVNYDDLSATVTALQPLAAAATHLVLMLTYPYPEGIVARLADEVVGRVG